VTTHSVLPASKNGQRIKITAQLMDRWLTLYLFDTTLGEKLSRESLWNRQSGKASAIVKTGSLFVVTVI
jgi:hypothetical protein